LQLQKETLILKIIIDTYIPYIKGVLEDVAEVEYMSYKQMTPASVADADALIVRTRTQCNKELLSGSKVQFIASATIGYDHIDANFCSNNGIRWTNAPGCNALSVAQYMASALSFLAQKNKFDLSTKTLGVIGVGAVGSKIAELAKSFGMRVLLNDPPRARKEGGEHFVTLADICKHADIISFHTLLNVNGEDKTMHLASDSFFEALERKPIIINASRGEIVNTSALLKAIDNRQVGDVVLDCWENEPDINQDLLFKTALATPHIAGYSAEGKANAATHSVRALSRYFGLGLDDWEVRDIPDAFDIDFSNTTDMLQFFLETYDIEADSMRMKFSPETFEKQRSHYPFRREPRAYLKQMNDELRRKLTGQFPLFLG
jgi:erythronate-4-phosphate dehydrogenase